MEVNSNNRPNKELICHCGPEFTGERCETRIEVCNDRCLNGGHCVKFPSGIPHCECPPGFIGNIYIYI